MRWKDKLEDKTASKLEVVAEFRSFVKPTWRPTLSEFCTNLTGITQVCPPLLSLSETLVPKYTYRSTQNQVDSAPLFPEVLEMFQAFMVKHSLLDTETGERLVRFCWCSDGPFDVRDFVVKQCFISKVREYIDLGWLIASCTPHNAGLGSNAGVDSRRCSRC
jgi:3'-5' exoribonuclease 1